MPLLPPTIWLEKQGDDGLPRNNVVLFGVQVGWRVRWHEWSLVNGSMMKRRDFTFHGLLAHEAIKEMPLFSDLGEDVFIPTPEKEYPPTHFLKVADVDKQ